MIRRFLLASTSSLMGGLLFAAPPEQLPGHEQRGFDALLKSELARVDPETDGWESEAFQSEAGSQLNAWASLLTQGDSTNLDSVVAPDITCSPLRPSTQRPIYQTSGITAWRAKLTNESLAVAEGTTAIQTEMQKLVEPWRDALHHLHIKTKIFTVDALTETSAITRALIQLDGPVGRSSHQLNATWRLTWSRSKESPPRLRQIIVEEHDEARSDNGQVFHDKTAALFRDAPVYIDHLRFGIDHWRQRLETTLSPGITSTFGVAVGDANGDGLDDLFLPQPNSLPDCLLIQQADGTVIDRAIEAGLNSLDEHTCALWLDLDNDGDQDLVVAGDAGVQVHENSGSLKFIQRAHLPFGATVDGLAAADYDQDGFVDVYLAGHTPVDPAQADSVLGMPIPIYDAKNGQPNKLFRNEGAWRFTDVTDSSGIGMNNNRFSYAASWEDFDNDGDQDLYVANDFGRNNLYQNTRGKFKDIAGETGVEDISSGMSVSWGDFNRDGLMDVYVGNMFSGAGNRVAYQRGFREGADSESLSMLRRMARGNSLFQNRGQGRFDDVSIETGVTMGRWAWSSQFIDFNNDGWEDLAIANGFVTNVNPDDL